MDALIQESRPLFEAVAGRGVRVEFALDAEDAPLRLDRGRVRQVLMNLIGNAADATAPGGGTVRVSTHSEFVSDSEALENGALSGGEFVVLEVSDDGCGMDPKTLNSAFEPFFTTKTDGRGTGLGLAITQSVVRQMHGFVRIESELGKGTTFRIHLPRPKTPSQVARARASERPRSVLVVDSALAERTSMVVPLGAAGYEVRVAPDTRRAAELLAGDTVDLLITDQYLTDGSGTVLARSARSVRPDMGVLVVSNGQLSDDMIDGVLVRPFDEQALLEAAEHALHAHGHGRM